MCQVRAAAARVRALRCEFELHEAADAAAVVEEQHKATLQAVEERWAVQLDALARQHADALGLAQGETTSATAVLAHGSHCLTSPRMCQCPLLPPLHSVH
jgi:ferric-dicitrate binding protein FerR (iron transport regulator)